jgi:hypothetical protein
MSLNENGNLIFKLINCIKFAITKDGYSELLGNNLPIATIQDSKFIKEVLKLI